MTKRAVDVAVSVIALVVFSPVMAVTAVLVLFSMDRPVLFRQRRPGLHGQPFVLCKFRTMRAGDGSGTDNDVARITPLGHVLRRTSLDELPQLWNVLRGDMSLIGPRPLLMEYLDAYTPEQARRHATRPGITGWAQVHGRDHLDWDERFALDTYYVDHRSLWLDLRIVLLSVRCVVDRREYDTEVAPLTRRPEVD